MRRILDCIVIIALFSGMSCGKRSNQPVVALRDGIEIVQNRGIPLSPEKTVHFIEDLKIGGENENGEIQLFQPRHIAVDKSGSIYISDASDKSIKVFDENGKYLNTIGRKGSGPGEFQSIGVIKFSPRNNLIVMDWRLRRVSFFDNHGKFLNSFHMNNFMYQIYLTTDSTVTCEENIYGESTKLFIKTFNLSGEEKIVFGQFYPEETKTLTKDNTSFGISVPYSPCSIFAGNQNKQWLYHCLNNKYIIEVYDNTGRLFRKIERPYNPVPYTNEDKKGYIKELEKNPNKVFVKMAKEVDFPRVKTITDNMVVDEKGNLWVETNEIKAINGKNLTAYDIFNEQGYYFTRVWSSIRPGIFARGYMYNTAVDDEEEGAVVKRYRVEWKKQ